MLSIGSRVTKSDTLQIVYSQRCAYETAMSKASCRNGKLYPLDVPRWCSDDRAPLLVTPGAGMSRDDIDGRPGLNFRYTQGGSQPNGRPWTLRVIRMHDQRFAVRTLWVSLFEGRVNRLARSLDKVAPVSRPVPRTGSIKSFQILGGLHHHYVAG